MSDPKNISCANAWRVAIAQFDEAMEHDDHDAARELITELEWLIYTKFQEARDKHENAAMIICINMMPTSNPRFMIHPKARVKIEAEALAINSMHVAAILDLELDFASQWDYPPKTIEDLFQIFGHEVMNLPSDNSDDLRIKRTPDRRFGVVDGAKPDGLD